MERGALGTPIPWRSGEVAQEVGVQDRGSDVQKPEVIDGWQPKHLRGASAERRRIGCKGNFAPTSISSGCLGTDERFRFLEAALQLKVTLRNPFIDQ